jgi:hypothetical protein
MDQQEPTPYSELQNAAQAANAAPRQTQTYRQPAPVQGNIVMGLLGGIVASVVGAGIWAGVTVSTEYQIGFMAVGVGLLVGLTVRGLGHGTSPAFGIIGALCALFGCLLGNILSMCGFAAIHESVPFFEITKTVLMDPSLAVELLKATFEPMDLLFYGIAVYEGFKFSFRPQAQQ